VSSARVTSIETVEHFRSALCEFGKEAKDSLCAIDMRIHRAFEWLEQQSKHWQKEVRVRQEELVRAKLELQSRKAMQKGGKGPGTTDQEKAFRKAQQRLKEAEDKVRCCRNWLPLLQREVHEYHGPARLLAGYLDTELVHALALLARKLANLDAYLSLAAPAVPEWAAVGAPAGKVEQTENGSAGLPPAESTTEVSASSSEPYPANSLKEGHRAPEQ
jgi:hypothetical protein